MHLEQYLLSLYRQAFDQQVSSMSPSTKDERIKSPLTSPRGRCVEISAADLTSKGENITLQPNQSITNQPNDLGSLGGQENVVGSDVHRCHSSLSQHSNLSTRTSPPAEPLGKALRACYSQPLSMMEVNSVLTHFSDYSL